MIAAHTVGFGAEGWTTQIAAVVAALLGALLLTWTERKWPDVQEAIIGVIEAGGSSPEVGGALVGPYRESLPLDMPSHGWI